VLGRYQVVRRAANGAFARVFEVTDLKTGEPRALKLATSDEAMLLDELEQLSRLRHPSLPRVFEVGRTTEAIDDVAAGAPFFVAEWVAGHPADRRPMTEPRRLWALLADVAGALAVVHAAGLVHGDVAPQNVLVVEDQGRAMLVDLGLANARGARGTPAFMAPEAFAGHVEPRSDLYSLGALAFRLATGAPPYGDADGQRLSGLGALVQRVLGANTPPPLPQLPEPLADLVQRMLARDREQRPASALAVLDELDDLAPAIVADQARRARPKVGPPLAPAEWPGARAFVEGLARELDARPVVHAVVGATGSGAHQLAEAALLRIQLAEVAGGSPSHPVIAGSLDAVAAAVVHDARTADEPPARWLERTARALRAADAYVVLDVVDDPRAAEAVAALARADAGRPIVVLVAGDPGPRDRVVVHRVPTLDLDGARALASAMIGGEPPRPWLDGLLRASNGLPVTAIELVRSIADQTEPYSIDWAARATAGTSALRARQLQTVGAGARSLAMALAAWGGACRLDRALAAARVADPATTLADALELERIGLAWRTRDELVIDRAATLAIQDAHGDALATAATRALMAAVGDDVPLGGLAALCEHARLDHELAARACAIGELLLARGRPDRARAVATRARTLEPARAALLLARAAAALGAYREVEPLATAARAAGAHAIEVELVVARAAQLAGELDDAEARLSALYARHADHPELAGTYSRLLVTRGRYGEAARVALACPAPLAGLRAEAAGLAAFYLGKLDDADRAFAALEVGGAAQADDAIVGRALSLRGMVAQQRGQLGLASDRYREAARKLADVGETHAAATAELNLGTALVERGRASEALPRLAAAGRVFAELAATTELVAADLNRGNALLAVGQAAEARDAAHAALSRDAGPHLHAFASIVLGDALRRLGDDTAAARAYRGALASAVERGDAHAQISAYIALAEAGLPPPRDVDVAMLCASADDRDRWTLARGRLALRGIGELAATACAEVAGRAADADRLERAFRAHAIAAQLALRARDLGFAHAAAARARAAHAALVAAAAPAFRAALDADPDLAQLPAAAPQPPVPRGTRDDAAHLRRLLTLSRRLNTEASVDRILDEVIDTAIELTAAERGFLLLRQTTGELAPVVSRNFAMADLAQPARASVSLSIAERAAQTGEPVLTVDAGVDERFAIAASVAALRLRSVLAVPLRQRGAITGCIYVDHRLRGGAFDEAAAATLGDLADIAAIAIENARLTDSLHARSREVDALNARLSAELAERDAELVRARADLPDRDRLRHRYERIVGRSPAMVRMLDLVDRAAATSLPVVIVGESGTGKELVARALHEHGPRKASAFVAINCSAVPEPLLESELFGHVRGAFTGADRDRRGLFEVADGGTLLLDEIAETSAAMQAKLLRVLQDGAFRRVGDTRTRQVNVRVIAATQRPLAELVGAGTFREDLRYRLEVIAIAVPALRERDGDLPLLVEHMFARLASGRPPQLTRAAVRALGQHRWPGNVRELENALARGVALGGDVIDLGDLPDAVVASSSRPEPQKPAVGDELRLKPAVAATEHAYIAAALSRAKGNQTVAARLLGLSRFGLQKKLRRLAGEDAETSADDD
jgi:transcriptional regulator with GAF, ATPase, and Fis domain